MASAARNRLDQESSPYLRQHAGNPVDWYPWGPEALAAAQADDKPIFLSIGYAACHWCHVMERESFEDEATAAILNEHFINIKVDREERPDLDQIYMNAVVALTRRGGWPMSVFLTPDQEPFFAGTYFPPTDRYGMPSFRRVLTGVVAAWRDRRSDVIGSASQITAHLREQATLETGTAELNSDLLKRTLSALGRAHDPIHGGFGNAPKFPHPLELRLLLRLWRRYAEPSALEMATRTLDCMAAGGIYDHLGGGFARYSTDERWLVPHFEKMLYDNALLAQAYTEAYLITGTPRYREVVTETLDWVLREMTGPEGCFFSSLDADSEGEEGKFYVWSAAEVEAVLGKERAEWFSAVYDVGPGGNWEGKSILHRPKSDEQDARLLGWSVEELQRRLAEARQELFAVRERRVRPGLDDKYLTAWNGLMISAFALAGQALDRRYLALACRAMDALLQLMRAPDGRLHRTASPGRASKLNGYLEDHAFILNALVDLFEATAEVRWLREAEQVAETLAGLFWDETAGGFFVVAKDHENLLLRSKDTHDNAVPAGNSVAALALLRLHHLRGTARWRELAERTLTLYSGLMADTPTACGQMLAAVDFYLGPVREYVLAGEPTAANTQSAFELLAQRFEPNRVLVRGDAATAGELLPALANRPARNGEVTLYLCEGQTCEAPHVGLAAIAQRLGKDAVPAQT